MQKPKLKTKSNIKYTIGIDEAGRGPIAGPVAVGACMIPNLAIGSLSDELLEKFMRGKLKDSKKLSKKKRGEIFKWMKKKRDRGELDFTVSMGSAKTIDEKGIVPTISKALSMTLTKLMKRKSEVHLAIGSLSESDKSELSTLAIAGADPTPGTKFTESDVRVLLDGGLKAPEVFTNQETIVKGDEKEIAISLASIAAKVTRDAFMCTLAGVGTHLADTYKKEGKEYGFERHKGYGTKAHYEAIMQYGLSAEHRQSFCKSVTSYIAHSAKK